MASKYAQLTVKDLGIVQAITQRTVVLAYLLYHTIVGIEIIGKENIPKGKNFIAACNHVSFSDPPLLAAALNTPMAFMAKDGLFNSPLKATFFKALGCISVNRDKLEIATIRSAKEIVKAGWILGIFPEGTRIFTEHLGKVNRGFAFLAKTTKTDVLPVAMIGTDKKFGKVTIKIGKLISTEEEGDNLVETWTKAMSELTGRPPYPEEETQELQPTES